MKLTFEQENPAVLSNVNEMGEFRIRNSAKAFSILSSGLYANKIRAVIRELSCNAVDSHVAAGRSDQPFDIHLPTSLEPWFAVRDYGVGLDHEQVQNIYTTYFESTKTASNDFIGALGLGSKSPFSCTDNFTVTAVKDGVKGIYTAFINEAGVPSIALMMQEPTDEPTGVEVKFSIDNEYDFYKYQEEASYVFQHFALQPTVSGAKYKQIPKEYLDRDLIPGVHSYRNSNRRSWAVMGNIAYPIQIPNEEKALGDLSQLLNSGLELHFDIGELDFQASREGLSYIPNTVTAIKTKLEQLNLRLVDLLEENVEKIDNLWKRVYFLQSRSLYNLWHRAVFDYVKAGKIVTLTSSSHYSHHLESAEYRYKVQDLAAKFNIRITAFIKNRYSETCSSFMPDREHRLDTEGKSYYEEYWKFRCSARTIFVVNDDKIGPTARVKNHWRNHRSVPNDSEHVYILDAADRTKPVKLTEFFAAINNPPEEQIVKVSDTVKEERKAAVDKSVTILKLQRKDAGNTHYYKADGAELVWRDAGELSVFDPKTQYYYVELNNFTPKMQKTGIDVKRMTAEIISSGLFPSNFVLYGVRKGDIDQIKIRKNWIDIETYVQDRMSQLTQKELEQMVIKTVDTHVKERIIKTVLPQVSTTSLFAVTLSKFQIAVTDVDLQSISWLMNTYGSKNTIDWEQYRRTLREEIAALHRRYPLLGALTYVTEERSDAIAEYINLKDLQP